MMIFKKALPRRTVLRGIGATMALPLLDAMVPAFASEPEPALRVGFVYIPNGIAMKSWTPAAEGTAYEMTPILQPLAPLRDRFLVLTGLNNNTAEPYPGDTDIAPHERGTAAWLTGVHAVKQAPLAISADQIIAKELAKETQLASLEIGLHTTELVGGCNRGWNCAYLDTFCWRTPTTPLPMENRPLEVFERLFGDSENTTAASRRTRIQQDRGVLDMVSEYANGLMKALGPNDRTRLAEYLDSSRDIERRLQKADEQSSRELPTVERPAGIPRTVGEHAKLMYDLMLLAYQTDLTRVISFMLDAENSPRPYPEIGVPDGHHPMSHHGADAEKIEKYIRINTYHSQLFAYFLEKLRSTPDGNGSLLDHSMILYGSGMSDGDLHYHTDLPALLAGGATGKLNGGRHIRYPKDTPLTNLVLTMLDKIGIHMDTLGDSTGRLDL